MPKIVAKKIDWINIGYQLFTESGISGINVDVMSRKLKCNKSSFYWHFKTKKEFMNNLIEHWVNIDTSQIIDKVNMSNNPSDKLRTLIKIAFKKDANLDFFFYLKKYAQSNIPIKILVDGINKERIDFVISLLMDIGYSKTKAELTAQVFYKYLIGYHEMIRYKPQKRNYLNEVMKELNLFINL